MYKNSIHPLKLFLRDFSLAYTFIVLATGLLLLACSNPNEADKQSGNISNKEYKAEMQLGYYPNLPDSVIGKVTLQPSQSMGMQFQIDQNPLLIQDLMPDTALGVDVVFSDNLDRIWYQGDTLIELNGGERTSLEMTLEPQFKALKVSIPLGYGNPLGISQGSLLLVCGTDSMFYNLAIENNQLGIIEIPQLFLNAEYSWTMNLLDGASNLLYQDIRTFRGSDLVDSNYVFHLRSLFAELGISLTLPDPTEVLFQYEFLNTQRRSPLPQELRITELMPNPKTSGDQWEWVELYSQSIDTLDLTGCYLSRTLENSTGTAISDALNGEVLPASYVSLGRDSVLTDYHYTKLTLLNSGQTLLLSCNGVVIDSIDYSKPSFGDFLNSGYSLALKTDELSWQAPYDSSSWCNENQAFTIGDNTFYGTPGEPNLCN